MKNEKFPHQFFESGYYKRETWHQFSLALQRFTDNLFGLEAIPLIKKKTLHWVLIDQHGGKKKLVGLRDDHHDRMTCLGTRHLDLLTV